MDEGYSTASLAETFGLPYVIRRETRPYDTTTLDYNWQVWNTQAFSLYTTSTSNVDKTGAGQAVMAVMNFLSGLGVIRYHGVRGSRIRVVDDKDLIFVRTEKSGIFEMLVCAGERVRMGQPLANIIDPYEGEIMETLYAPVDSIVFFIHSEPMTYASTAVIRLLAD